MHILLIEDHEDVADLVGRALVKDGHHVSIARTLAEADACMASPRDDGGGGRSAPDAAVLDLGLPDGSGLVWCKRIRAAGVAIPILVLTAQSAVATRVAGLDAGADDFLAKPFAVAELRARLRALARRGPMQRPVVMQSTADRRKTTSDATTDDDAKIHLDFAARRAKVGDTEVPLTSREWSIIELLVSRSGRMVSRVEILEACWGDASLSATASSSLEVIVSRIRKKLGASFIRTLRGEGYAVEASE